MSLEQLKIHLLNLRPYSWVDLLLLGLLAKSSAVNGLAFTQFDLLPAAGLLCLWFFFNVVLEFKHGYAYRAKSSLAPAVCFLVLAVVIGCVVNALTFVFVVASTVLVLFYLQKSGGRHLGIFSSVIRGAIQAAYFLYALAFYSPVIAQPALVLAVAVFLLYAARAVVGDLRDFEHNKEAKKQTIPVVYGRGTAKCLVAVFLVVAIVLQTLYFEAWLVSVPLLLFGAAVVLYDNGFVLHWLFVATTSFFSVNMITYFTGQNLIFVNVVYLAVFLNFIFYPLLARKSNPKFVQRGGV